MKVGFITHWYDPEIGSASLSGTIARALQRDGDDVRVLTGFPNYPSGAIYPGYSLRPYKRESLDGVDVRRVLVYPSHDSNALRRLTNYASFAASGAFGASTALRDRDVNLVFCSPATAAAPALTARALNGKPYVLYVQDLWPDSVVESGFLKSPRLQRFATGAIERALAPAYRHAASIAVISPGMRDALAQRGVPEDKIRVIPNWADESAFRPVPRDEVLAKHLGLRTGSVVMYAGNMGEMQGLDALLDAASRLKYRRDVQFAFVGGGVVKNRLVERATQEGLSNVVFVEPQPFAAMAKILAMGDIQVVSLADRPLLRITTPSKLQGVMAAGRPVLGMVAGDAAEIIEESGAGVVVTPGDGAGAALAIEQLLADPIRLRRMAETANATYRNCFSQAAGVDALLGVLREAASTR